MGGGADQGTLKKGPQKLFPVDYYISLSARQQRKTSLLFILRFHSPFFEWNGPESVTERGFDSIGATFFCPNNRADSLQHAPGAGRFSR